MRIEPLIHVESGHKLEYHGNAYCGWAVPAGCIHENSVVVDVGLGEDITFSRSLSDKYDCDIHGFDPTPRAIGYVQSIKPPNFHLHEFGIGDETGEAEFHLPNNEQVVSGTVRKEKHTGLKKLVVKLVSVGDLFEIVKTSKIDLLKMDIEGAEFDVIFSKGFAASAPKIGILCIEFHHRWESYGKVFTEKAVARLNELGFKCCWSNSETNEEFTFFNKQYWGTHDD